MELLNVLRRFLNSTCAKATFWLLTALICTLLLAIFLSSLGVSSPDEDVSTQHLQFSPKPLKDGVIYFRYKNYSYNKWVKRIDKFLEPYHHMYKQVDCDFHNPPKANESCKVDLESFFPCISSLDFGYRAKQPCVFIKFKKTLNFTPEFFNVSQISKAQLGFDYTNFIREDVFEKTPEVMNSIWVSCAGKTVPDNNLLGAVKYIHGRGFPGYFFPYRGQKNYVEPLVAIQFLDPRADIIIDVECKVVALNFNETISFSFLIKAGDYD